LNAYTIQNIYVRPKPVYSLPELTYHHFSPPPALPFMPTIGETCEIKKKLDLRRPYRILCLDGGGVRGVLTTVILERIVEKFPMFLNDIDMIAGTSAGGILSLLLACEYTPKECTDIYT